jgi:hypothetical protein
MKFIQEDKKIGRWTIGYLSLEDGSFLIRERCDNLQDAIKMLHDLNEDSQNKANLNNVDALIGKKYYQLSYDEKLIIADIFKTGRKLGMKLVVNLPKNSDEALIQSLNNGIWGIYEMEHPDAQGIEVQIETI